MRVLTFDTFELTGFATADGVSVPPGEYATHNGTTLRIRTPQEKVDIMSEPPQNEQSWSGVEVGRYEAALEAIHGAIGAYSALIAQEEAKDAPDEQVIEEAHQGQCACIRRREDLDPTDATQVAQVRTEFSALAETVRASHR